MRSCKNNISLVFAHTENRPNVSIKCMHTFSLILKKEKTTSQCHDVVMIEARIIIIKMRIFTFDAIN